MKRSPMRRTPMRRTRTTMTRTRMVRGHVPVGRKAAARRKAGGPRATGRASLSVAAWRAVVEQVRLRAKGRCECGCGRAGVDPEHAVPRSRGGSDHPDNVWWAARECHRAKEASYATGRLLVEPLGAGRFRFTFVQGPSKWEHTVLWARESRG